MFYCSGLSLRDSADDKTRLWIIALTKCIFMVEAMFVTNARDSYFSSYHMWIARFNNLSGSILFFLSKTIVAALKHFVLYKFALIIG